MDYQVVFVGDHELPEGQDWLVGHVPDGWVGVIKESRLTPAVLEETWAAFMDMYERSRLDRQHVPHPRQVPADALDLGALVAVRSADLRLA